MCALVPTSSDACSGRFVAAVLVALVLVGLVGCGTDTRRDAAVWELDRGEPPTRFSARFTALVTRLGCSGGVTGEVFGPRVDVRATEIVVTFTVAPLKADAYTCMGNDRVARTVIVGEPIGARRVVDGGCQGEAKSTSFCEDGAVRWSP